MYSFPASGADGARQNQMRAGTEIDSGRTNLQNTTSLLQKTVLDDFPDFLDGEYANMYTTNTPQNPGGMYAPYPITDDPYAFLEMPSPDAHPPHPPQMTHSGYGQAPGPVYTERKQVVNGLWNVPVPGASGGGGSDGKGVSRHTRGMPRGGMYGTQGNSMRSTGRSTMNLEPVKPVQVLSEYADRKAKRDKKEYEMQMGLHMIDKKRKDKLYQDLTRTQDKHLLRDKPHVARADLEALRYKQNSVIQSRIRFEGLVERRRQGRERVVGSQAELNRLQQVHFTERENVRRSIFRDVVKTEVEFLETMKRMGVRTVAGLADAFA